MVLCFVPFLVETAVIYIASSPSARAVLGLEQGDWGALKVDFYFGTMTFQGALAFLLAAWVAPVLVSPDLVNGALPLYLSRPFSRTEYVLGKAAVLVALLSAITWVPGLTLFALQAGLTKDWLLPNLRIAAAIFAGAWVWIVVLTLLGLALSACIRWRIVASGALVGIFFMGTAFGEMWHAVLRGPWGRLANLSYLIAIVLRQLFGYGPRNLAREMLDDRRTRDLPTWAAWMGLLAICAFCVLLLNRRLRAREVVS